MNGSLPSWLDILDTFGVLGVLVLILWLIQTKRLVPGWAYRAMEERAERGTQIAEAALRAALDERGSSRGRADA